MDKNAININIQNLIGTLVVASDNPTDEIKTAVNDALSKVVSNITSLSENTVASTIQPLGNEIKTVSLFESDNTAKEMEQRLSLKYGGEVSVGMIVTYLPILTKNGD